MHNIRFSFRNMLKNKTQSLVGMAGISIAFCCFVLSVIWLRYETGYDSWHAHSDRIYRILKGTEAENNGVVDAPLAQRLKGLFPEIEEAATVLWWHSDKLSYDDVALENCYETDSCFFRIFSVDFIEGNNNLLGDYNQIILTESTAVSFFGSPRDAVGKAFKGNEQEYIVSAVIRDFKHSNLNFNALVRLRPSGWRNSSYFCFCMLKEHADYTAFSKKLEEVFINELSVEKAYSFLAVPIARMHYKYHSPEQQHVLSYVYIKAFAWAALLLLLCAMTNFISLFIGLLLERFRELDIRRCMGSRSLQLFALVFAQFTAALLLALLVGTGLIEAVKPSLQKAVTITINGGYLYLHVGLSMLFCFCCTTLIALYPVWRLSTQNFRSAQRALGLRQWFRRILVVIQFAVGFFFLFITAVMYRQLHFIHTHNVGYDRKNVVQIRRTSDMAFNQRADLIVEEITQLSGVRDAYLQFFPLQTQGGVTHSSGFTCEGVTFEEGLMFNFLYVNYGFPDFFGVPIRSGRFFSKEIPTDAKKILVNETLAKMIGGDPVGKELIRGNQRLEIIGVMADINDQPLTRSVEPAIIAMMDGNYTLYIRAEKEMIGNVIKQTAQIFKSQGLSPLLKYELMDDIFADYSKSENLMMSFIGIMSAASLAISVFGIYSLALFAMVRRRREVAIRRVFGAGVKDIVRAFLGAHLLFVLISALIALPIAYWLMDQWLQEYAYRIAVGWSIAALSVITVCMVVVATILRQVLKVSNSNPAEVIKLE